MQMSIEIEGDYKGKMIAPLLLIPFVENSFKHGASKIITHPWVALNIKIENDKLCFIIRNSQPITNEAVSAKGNIGLKNVKKRLALLYSLTHQLNIVCQSESYAVQLDLQLLDIKDQTIIKDEIKPMSEYALA